MFPELSKSGYGRQQNIRVIQLECIWSILQFVERDKYALAIN